MRLLSSLLAAAALLSAADSDFNGRWDIRVPDEVRGRAWWLEVSGAGTPNIQGKFVGFPGGNMDDIQKIWIENGQLKFTFDRDQRKGGSVHQAYTVRVAGHDKIEGVMESGRTKLNFVGVRAPEIKDKDDGSWKEAKPVVLFNGKDLDGWHGSKSTADLGWTVENGLLKSTGGAKNLETDQKFWNFKLHLEFNVAPHSNSGIGLRGRYEVQILEDKGQPRNKHSNGALYSRIAPAMDASKPANEWQTYDIRLVGRHVEVVLNGQQTVKGEIEGLTAIADDADEGKPGPIVLQGDHGPISFRNIVLTPLVHK